LCSAWLVCEPGTSAAAGEVDSQLGALLARAKARGAGTTFTSALERPGQAEPGHAGGMPMAGDLFNADHSTAEPEAAADLA
jgi:hypothetical protein